jgi:hypothetical protein
VHHGGDCTCGADDANEALRAIVGPTARRAGSGTSRGDAAKMTKVTKARRRIECKYCGCRLSGVSPIAPLSLIYDRQCPERDGDACERAAP